MDPLSITASCVGILSAIEATSAAVTAFIKGCREARSDLEEFIRELSDLRRIIELLKDDSNTKEDQIIPQRLQTQVISIIDNCRGVLDTIDRILDNHKGKLGTARWTIAGKAKVASLRQTLEAHSGALSLALETVQIALSKQIKHDTSALRNDTSHILAGVAELRAILDATAGDLAQPREKFVLRRYLDDLTSYAETICEESFENGDGGDHIMDDIPDLSPTHATEFRQRPIRDELVSRTVTHQESGLIGKTSENIMSEFPDSVDTASSHWGPVKGVECAKFRSQFYLACAVAFSPDGKLLASGSTLGDKFSLYQTIPGTVMLWDVMTGAEKTKIQGHSRAVMAVAFSPDGKLLASGSWKTIRLWDPITGAEQAKFQGHSHWVHSLTLSPDGKLLASGSHDKTIRLWDLVTRKQRRFRNRSSLIYGHVHALAFSPDGKLIASPGGPKDANVRLWDVATGDKRGELKGHLSYVLAIAFSPDGKLLASGSNDRTIRIWNTTTQREHGKIEAHSAPVWTVAFSPDGNLLASGSGLTPWSENGKWTFEHWNRSINNNTINLWNPVTGDACGKIQVGSGVIATLAFSPDGKVLASGGDHNAVRLWKLSRETRLLS